MKKLSIIIRCYNRLEYLIRTIISIDEKSGLNRGEYELILVDQASTDGTKDWISSAIGDGYYPISAVFLSENVGDGLGLQEGTYLASGEFLSQHDNDIELVTEGYYSRLIKIYEELELRNIKICSLSGSHVQGFEKDSAPFRFAKDRPCAKEGLTIVPPYLVRDILYPVAWTTASFIFRRRFSDELEFTKGMTNSWGGDWFDRGYIHFICEFTKFWHIDSDLNKTGAHVKKQAEKFPSYKYINKHYRNFI